MIGNIVARRYARALYAIGSQKGINELEVFGNDLSGLASAIEGTPELLKIFRNPTFTLEEKRGVADKILEKTKASPIVRNFCHLLADKGRLQNLPEIAAVFNSLLDVEKGVVRGTMITAVKLNKNKQTKLLTKLEEQAGRKLEMDFDTDKSIVGGLVLKIGDRTMDASLKAQLDILKENIKRGE